MGLYLLDRGTIPTKKRDIIHQLILANTREDEEIRKWKKDIWMIFVGNAYRT